MLSSPFNSFRKPSTAKDGRYFSPMTKIIVWNKAVIVLGHDPAAVRKDSCGAWIKFSEYGNAASEHGWEIDHIKPVAKGGGDEIENLQPLHWQNNRGKSDNWPNWSCSMSASTS